jgi:PII-like signaling protein
MTKAKILRIYASNTDKIKQKSLFEAIAFEAKSFGMAGATVYKGIMGYGTSSEMISDKFWELTDKTPVIIEIIDESEKIMQFIDHIKPWLDDLPKGYLMITSDADIQIQKKGKKEI